MHQYAGFLMILTYYLCCGYYDGFKVQATVIMIVIFIVNNL